MIMKKINFYLLPAENIGFEPMVQLPVHLISSQAQSTTLAIFLFLYSLYQTSVLPLSYSIP